MKRPSFQYYPSDWRKDAALQSCRLAARGLWIEVMCIAHECVPYGHLTINGHPMTVAQIARLVGVAPKECEKLLAELASAGVTSVSDAGAIYSRRMVRDEELRNIRAAGGIAGAEHGAKGAEHGIKGGRPKVARGVSEPPIEPPPSSSSSSSSSASAEDLSKPSASHPAEPGEVDAAQGKRPTVPCPYDAIVDAYHRELPSLPSVRLRDGPTWVKRQKAMRTLWGWVLSSRIGDGSRRAETSEQALDWVNRYFRRASENDFVMGRTHRSAQHESWICDFDFLLSDKGLKQVVEKTVGRHAA